MNKTFFDIDLNLVTKQGPRNFMRQEHKLVGDILRVSNPDTIDHILFNPTESQFRQLTAGLFGDRYTYPTPWLGPDKPIIVHCCRHDIDFPVSHAHWHTHGLNAHICPVCSHERFEREFLQSKLAEAKRTIERIAHQSVELPSSEAQPAADESQDDYDTLLTVFAIKGEA